MQRVSCCGFVFVSHTLSSSLHHTRFSAVNTIDGVNTTSYLLHFDILIIRFVTYYTQHHPAHHGAFKLHTHHRTHLPDTTSRSHCRDATPRPTLRQTRQHGLSLPAHRHRHLRASRSRLPYRLRLRHPQRVWLRQRQQQHEVHGRRAGELSGGGAHTEYGGAGA
jgi:hypothetical protein